MIENIKGFKIEWDIKKNNYNLSKYNILSVCYYKLKNSYRDVSVYYNGLKNIILSFENILEDFILRIYYDDTVNEEINSLKNILDNKKIELYKYKVDINDNEHVGMMMRFLPLFNLKLHKCDSCIIFDIDNILNKNYNKIIKYVNNNNIKFLYRTRFLYGIKERLLCIMNIKKLEYPIINSFIYCSVKISNNLIKKIISKYYIYNN